MLFSLLKAKRSIMRRMKRDTALFSVVFLSMLGMSIFLCGNVADVFGQEIHQDLEEAGGHAHHH